MMRRLLIWFMVRFYQLESIRWQDCPDIFVGLEVFAGAFSVEDEPQRLATGICCYWPFA